MIFAYVIMTVRMTAAEIAVVQGIVFMIAVVILMGHSVVVNFIVVVIVVNN